MRKKIANGIILTLTSGLGFIRKYKNELVKIAFLLQPLLPDFDLFINLLKL